VVLWFAVAANVVVAFVIIRVVKTLLWGRRKRQGGQIWRWRAGHYERRRKRRRAFLRGEDEEGSGKGR